jgi:hypothetical protein
MEMMAYGYLTAIGPYYQLATQPTRRGNGTCDVATAPLAHHPDYLYLIIHLERRLRCGNASPRPSLFDYSSGTVLAVAAASLARHPDYPYFDYSSGTAPAVLIFNINLLHHFFGSQFSNATMVDQYNPN